MSLTTIEHKTPDRAVTEKILDPAEKTAADLDGFLDQRMARLTGFSRGWPAVDFLRGLAGACKQGEKQALAEVGHAMSLTEAERWEAGQILRLWRSEAPAAAVRILAEVTAEWHDLYGSSAVPPPLTAGAQAGPDLEAPPGRQLSPGAEAIFGKRGRRH